MVPTTSEIIDSKWACSVVVNKFRSKRTVGQADMTLALLGHNLYKYLGYNLILSNTF